MNIKISFCKSDEEILETFKVMRQLRDKFSNEQHYLSFVKQMQHLNNYQLVALNHDGICRSVLGYKTYYLLFTVGKELYIDDLVTDEKYRGYGFGKKLLDWVKTYAKKENFKTITLDSADHRKEAHKFYLRENFVADLKHFRFALK